MSRLSVNSLCVQREGRVIIRDISFESARGVTMLLGPNGCGKSTLMQAISGIIPCRGNVFLDEKNISAMSVRARASVLSYLPQRQVWDTAMTVLDYVSMGAGAGGSLFAPPDSKAVNRASGVLEAMGLSFLSGRSMNRISGGEARLAGIARAAAQGGDFMVMDEPLAGLDYSHIHSVLDYIRNECPDSLISIHDPALAWQYGDKVLLMDKGEIKAEGTKGNEGDFEYALQDTYGKNIAFTSVHGQLLPMQRRI